MSRTKPVKTEQHLGVMIPLELSDKITLLTVARNESKSRVIRIILEREFERVGEQGMINVIVDNLFSLWCKKRRCTVKVKYRIPDSKFNQMMQQELKKKGLRFIYVKKIMEKLRWKEQNESPYLNK